MFCKELHGIQVIRELKKFLNNWLLGINNIRYFSERCGRLLQTKLFHTVVLLQLVNKSTTKFEKKFYLQSHCIYFELELCELFFGHIRVNGKEIKREMFFNISSIQQSFLIRSYQQFKRIRDDLLIFLLLIILLKISCINKIS